MPLHSNLSHSAAFERPRSRASPALEANAAARFARANAEAFTRALQQFVRIPSVSSDPNRAGDVRKCAEWLRVELANAGLRNARIFPTPRHPIVYAESLQAKGRPTILIYGHYDVQPAEPLRQWKNPPFAATLREGFVHGRGASDDKGQLLTHVKAIESLFKSTGAPPLNVKCLFEGEEEIGSPNLQAFVQRNRKALAADAAVMSDTRMLGADQPALTYSLRGQLALELRVRGPGHDLHSGNFGGAIHDPLQALCEILARLHDQNGRVAVPGFYDRVRVCPHSERAYLARTGPSDETILGEAAAANDWGEHDYSIYERLTIRPSLAITGLRGGHIGPGPKGVIPSEATAKISFRLVPDQDPPEIEKLVRAHLQRIAPPTVRLQIETHISSRPALLPREHPAMRAAATAYTRAFGKPPVWLRSGGSIPVVEQFQRILGIPTVMMGFASPGDNLHGPNERFSLRNFHRAILTSIYFLQEFARHKLRQLK